LKHVIELRIEGMVKRERRRKLLLDDLKETRGYWKMKEEALGSALWRAGFGNRYGPVLEQTVE